MYQPGQADQIRFGRLHQPDERDRRFLMPAQRRVASLPSRRTWYVRGVLDQGNTPQCVGYSGWKYLPTHPIVTKPDFTPTELYKDAQRNDEWPGEDYDGTSVRGLFKVLKRRGLVSEYRWADGIAPIIQHVLEDGPVVMGTNWKFGMLDTDADGYVEAEGEDVGGHAWLLIGCDRLHKNPSHIGGRGFFRALNSWGGSWGQNGRFRISFDHLELLVKEPWAEAAVATEVKG